jgi:F0F1-type ATP synthase assembly protein I
MNVDSRVKVGDYYFYGLGTDEFEEEVVTESSSDSSSDDDEDNDDDENEEKDDTDKKNEKRIKEEKPEIDETSRHEIKNSMIRFSQKLAGCLYGKQGKPDYSVAFNYYQAAADNEKSTLAMWNLAFMYEYGIGVKKDLFLAKRYYDRSLEINPYASFPINLALTKLNIKVYIHNLKCSLTHREDEYIIFKEDKEGTDNKINFDDGDDETSKSINERIKSNFKNKDDHIKEPTLREKILNSLELDNESKHFFTEFLLKFLIGYGIGYIIYAIIHYYQNRRFPNIRFSILIIYIFVLSTVVGNLLSEAQEELQIRLRNARNAQ